MTEDRKHMTEDPIADYLRSLERAALDAWPNCSIPDCEHKVCTWATDCYCAPHSLELLGPEEMIVRWNRTHPDLPWDKPWPPGNPPRAHDERTQGDE